MSLIPSTIRAVFFDAVGTLLHPAPRVADAYAAVGARFGSKLDRDAVSTRFHAAFARQEQLDAAAAHRTDEAREVARWLAIVTDVLDDVGDSAECFHELYDHFARPQSWRVDPDAGAMLRSLARRGLLLGVCSNFDRRLHGLITAMPELADVRHLVVSSEVGWKKPSEHFFAEVARLAQMTPREILIVGDDAVNDFDGARAAGFHALLLDPSADAKAERIARLSDLVK